MATKLGVILADFTTSLATALAVGGTSATLQSAVDDDGIALPAGRYFFALDGNNSNKEHISCVLSGTSLTSIQSLSRQGVEASGVVRAHRIGCTVTLTDFAHIKFLNDYLLGTMNLPAATPLAYDGVATLTPGSNQLATVKYADGLAIAGSPDATTGQKGISKISVAPVSPTAPIAVGDNDYRIVNYFSETGAANAYVITPSPSIGAYAVGQRFSFKAANGNTTASTLNINGLGAIAIKRLGGVTALVSGDIATGQMVLVEYDGTNFQMLSPSALEISISGGAQGDVPYFNGSIWTRLPAGTSGQVLSTQGASANPQWVNAFTSIVSGSAADPSVTSGTPKTVVVTHGLGKTPQIVMFSGGFTVPVNNGGSGLATSVVAGFAMVNSAGAAIGGFQTNDAIVTGSTHALVSGTPNINSISGSTGGSTWGMAMSVTISSITSTQFTLTFTATRSDTGASGVTFNAIAWTAVG